MGPLATLVTVLLATAGIAAGTVVVFLAICFCGWLFDKRRNDIRQMREADQALLKLRAEVERKRQLIRDIDKIPYGSYVEVFAEKRRKPKVGTLVGTQFLGAWSDGRVPGIEIRKPNGRLSYIVKPVSIRQISLLELMAYESDEPEGIRRRRRP